MTSAIFMQNTNLNFAIIGAGIGGLTVALALKQQGFGVAVYERTSVMTEIGAGLLLSPNAVSILDALGLREELRTISIETPEWRVLNSNGAILAKIHPQVGEVPGLSLRRSDLQQLLVRRLEPNLIHLDFEAIQITPGKDGRRLIDFANGEQVTHDWVIAADGIHSQIRNSFFQETVQRRSHYVGWRAMVDFIPKGWENGMVTETWGRGMRFGLASTGSNRCYWYASANRGFDQATKLEERKPLLLQLFKEWHHPVKDVLSATPHGQILETSIAERPVPKHWHKNGVILLGDAAHAMTPNLGQGAAMAVEDAWELSECLKNNPTISRALNLYEQHRRHRVQIVQWASRWVGLAIQTESPFLCAIRDNLVRITPSFATRASLRWIFQPSVKD